MTFEAFCLTAKLKKNGRTMLMRMEACFMSVLQKILIIRKEADDKDPLLHVLDDNAEGKTIIAAHVIVKIQMKNTQSLVKIALNTGTTKKVHKRLTIPP
mmetsp:Transcript_24954/g.40478  ORF Transcript_24954/g.40478 Transcript_24954/m.40478 type:complete len:99 (-) Transcript_24954:194-490(-)